MFPQIAGSPSGQLWLLALIGTSHKPDVLWYWNGHSWTRRDVPEKALDLTYGSSGVHLGQLRRCLARSLYALDRTTLDPRHPAGAHDSVRAAITPALSRCYTGRCLVSSRSAEDSICGRMPP
jgi:hypothetical protein